ncbi:MAG: M14 family metallopeptidase [Piscinibacter sp.]|nr:M14 family metallopeptidase [Piscinibacter sp.]
MDTRAAFSQDYAEARGKFLAAAEEAGLDAEPQVHPLLGRDGETLALDMVYQGPKAAPALLIVSSGCHGVEGYCGSAVQTALLRDPDWHARVHASGAAVLYLHALNPYGFSWCRRTTQENVDLNRNFRDFHQPPPANPVYDEIAALLVPATWPPSPEVNAALQRFVAERGFAALQQAVTTGQYAHPEGLFFGGHDPTWSHVALRHALREHGRHCARLAWIDLHTGLGPPGVGERIWAGRDDPPALARAKVWFGERVTSIYDGSSSAALLTGLMWNAAYEECPQAEYTGIALEFGTVPLAQTLEALRAEQWLENHPEVDDTRRASIKRQLREAFYVETPAWQQAVLAQSLEVAAQALKGLGSTAAGPA